MRKNIVFYSMLFLLSFLAGTGGKGFSGEPYQIARVGVFR